MAVDSISPVFSVQATYALEPLASGQRINRSADDPAGQAVATGFTSQIRQMDVAGYNANAGMNLLQTADGVTSSIVEQAQRMRELSLQSMGTVNDAQRTALNAEFQQGIQSIAQMTQTAQFNGIPLLDNSTPTVSIALGEGSSDLSLPDLSPDALGLSGLDLSSSGNAQAALEQLGLVLNGLSDQRASFGAQQNGLLSSVSQLAQSNQNAMTSRSQISDADMAKAVMQQTRQQILESAGVAMQVHRQQSDANAVQLLTT